MLALQALAYIEGNDRNGGPIWNYATGSLTCWKGAQPDRVIQLNCGEVRTHASYKKTEHGRTSTTEEQKLSSFRQTMINS